MEQFLSYTVVRDLTNVKEVGVMVTSGDGGGSGNAAVVGV